MDNPKYNKPTDPSITLLHLSWEFLKIGFTGFGGGLAIIGLFYDRFVKKLALITHDEFAQGLALSQFLGAFAVNMSTFIGKKLHGFSGALIATISFLSPAIGLVILLTHMYFTYQQTIPIHAILSCVAPVIIAILAITCIRLSAHLQKNWLFIAILLGVFISVPFQVNFVIVIITAGLLTSFIENFKSYPSQAPTIWFSTNLHLLGQKIVQSHANTGILALLPNTLWSVSLIFISIGFLFFGGGYALLPLMQNIFVTKLQWISIHDFMVGVTISQSTPGPVAVIATFIGYYLQGISGGLIASLCIFTPPFIVMLILIKLHESWRENKHIRSFLKGITIAVIGQILVITYHFFNEFLTPFTLLHCILLTFSLLSYFLFNISPIILILIGLISGLLFAR